MKKHSGQIEVEPSRAQSPPESAHAKRVPKTGQGLVLVMDDDDMVRRVACSMLKHFGYEALPAANGSEALERTRGALAEGRQLTAAVLDLTVRSGEGGRDIVGRLRELLPSLPIIAASGYSDDPVMVEPQAFGFSASLRKPFPLTDLGELLSQLIEDAQP